MLMGRGSGGDPGLAAAGQSIREIARILDVARHTVRRYLRREGLPRYQRLGAAARQAGCLQALP
jgi:DNA-binding CsgD family transcriptional regulator